MRKPFRAGGVAVGALAVALAAGAFAFAPASAAVTTVTTVTNLQALNWAGYAASRGTTTFRFVSAQFTVPTVDCTGVTAANGAWSGHWIGLDGFRTTSGTVEQIGVIAGCDGTTPQYAAFWEMFPNPAGTPTSITVTPGDTVSLSVYYNRSTRKFTL